FYFRVLHQAARAYKRMNLRKKAVAFYLRLYDEILQHETAGAAGASGEKEGYGFFKNEALDYLNQNVKEEEGNRESRRFTRARAREGLDKLSELDITLRWQFFEVTPPPVVDRKDDDAFTFEKIREFYLPKDEKTLFYKEVKELKPWTRTDIAFAGITRDDPGTPPLFFGFLISFDFLQAGVLQQAARKHLGDEADDGLAVSVENDGGTTGFQLVRLPFNRFFTSRFLVLHADRKGYVEATVEKDLWINYGLIAAIISLFILGTWFFYKYITREAELVRMKSDFVDSASHTLKTPLTRIRMMAEKMELGWIKDEKKKKEYFRTIISETDRMAEMITNMLDFSKVESGKKHYQMEQASITELVRAVIDSLTPHIESLGFQLEVKIGEDIPSFSFDPGAVRLILVNLVQNALKYAAEGKYIGITLYKDGSRAAMKVTDRGMGIPVAEWENIFDKFYRVPDDTVKAMEGSGLGLFLVHHAVNAHNGTIAVKSKPGKGSTFTVTLPLKK
ncbi:MAG: HAMP domain-containing histidine kinase, partial [bacterium]|nr:HAMP domain-containing histidine kinase [bacterium]